jgi:hypothetical protein
MRVIGEMAYARAELARHAYYAYLNSITERSTE